MNILAIIILFAIAQGVFLGILMITVKRGNRKANRVWGILLILFGLSILPIVMISANLYEYFPHIYLTGHPLILLFGPLMMLYTIYLTTGEFKFKAKHVAHLIPFIAYVALLSPIYIQSGAEKIAMISSMDEDSMIAELIVSVCIVTHVFVYLYFINKRIGRYDKLIKDSYSSLNMINLTWLRHSVYSMAAIFTIMAALIALATLSEILLWSSYIRYIIPLLVAIVLIYDTYKTIHQPEIFIGNEITESQRRYEKSSLTESKAQIYQKKLLEYMDSEKPYKESNLTIKDLASKVKIPSYHISQIINEKLNQNFFDFINRYRIEEIKSMFKDPQYSNYSILAISYEAGFNSKSVFNSSFKKYTGITPSEYRQKVKVEIND